ncbi:MULTISPECIES: questin oxidase family protein [unclassified Microbulbifer]|uniref:questin oxidase family protein n=1 Tax=unclassified Microbulbifer TaxID=2619833 RepID=UPI0027E58243|nr:MULTISPECIES: questin oxidase family protein [unclassified Microbulbifer]
MSITRYCAELLEAASRYHVRYGDRLANHLPMVLIALDKMGASRRQLKRAFERCVPFLERPQLPPPAPSVRIAECRNREELYPSALRYYELQMKEHDIEECLRRELPPLLPAIATAAFHPLIRTAYGIDAEHQQEIATGLAYWNLEYHTLLASREQIPMPAREIPSLLAERYPLISLAPGNISDHMFSVTQQHGWLDTPIQPEQLGLEDIARVAIDAYRGTGDFTLLHGVTGCHALRLVLPYCLDPEIALRYFWTGFVAAYLSTGPKEIHVPTETGDIPSWKAIRKKARLSSDDHVVKLTYSCSQEFEQYGLEDYLYAAARAVDPMEKPRAA